MCPPPQSPVPSGAAGDPRPAPAAAVPAASLACAGLLPAPRPVCAHVVAQEPAPPLAPGEVACALCVCKRDVFLELELNMARVARGDAYSAAERVEEIARWFFCADLVCRDPGCTSAECDRDVMHVAYPRDCEQMIKIFHPYLKPCDTNPGAYCMSVNKKERRAMKSTEPCCLENL